MSRCFAYPVQGYLGKGRSDVALIDSIKSPILNFNAGAIKFQTGSELSKAEANKDGKRDKKERRKEKNDQLKASLLPEKKIHKGSTGLKIRSLQKLIQTENEQLERSSLTEEHAKPVGEQKPSTSSDSTQNSSKRKRESSPPPIVKQEEPSIRSNGNVIRIRLSSLKRNAPLVAQPPCSTTSGKALLPSHMPSDINIRQEPCSTSTSGRLELATNNRWQETQGNIPSVQQRNKASFSVVRPKFEVHKGSSISVPKSVTRDENASHFRPLPENKIAEVAPYQNEGSSITVPKCPKMPAVARYQDKVSSISVPKSVSKDENTSHFRLLPVNKLPEVALPPKQVCSALGELKSITHIEEVAVCELPKGALPPRVPKAITSEDDIPFRDPKSLDKKMVKADSKYRDLFINWVPPPPQLEIESDDQDWLFSKKRSPDNQTDKKLKLNNSLPCCGNVSLWPRAQFIPEVDIYALPFTVPF